MKIAFFLGSPDINGGTYVIFEHATRLQKLGHIVFLLTDENIDPVRYAWHPAASALQWRTYHDDNLEYFDFTIATWWQSIFLLKLIKSRRYLYFVQSIESRFFPSRDTNVFLHWDIDILRDWCENTYRIPLPVITEADWIRKYLHQHYNKPSYLVHNGIRKDLYTHTGKQIKAREEGKVRVLVEGPLGVFFKNVERTIEICRQAKVDEVWLLTSSDVSEYKGVDRCFSKVPIKETAAIYRSCDILVKLSYVEGMFGPPLEMFHCGGTALVYDVTGHDEYIRHEENSIVVKKDDEDDVISWLNRLKKEPLLLAKLKEGAKKTADEWPGWDASAELFEKALMDCVVKTSEMSSEFLENFTDFCQRIRETCVRDRGLGRFSEREQRISHVEEPFVNHLQIHWDRTTGYRSELTDAYQSGKWSRCCVTLPAQNSPILTIRVDPSVRIGVVAIRSIRIFEKTSEKLLAEWNVKSCWETITVSGTANLLQAIPYPVLEAYGEDPQLILPEIAVTPSNEEISVEVEVFEMSMLQALKKNIFDEIVHDSFVERLKRYGKKFFVFLNKATS